MKKLITDCKLDWEKALLALKEGNAKFLKANKSEGDISLDIRKYTYTNGQKPFAVVISCSDSRVVPESIFLQVLAICL